ncbi:MAG TPA: integrase core domain-containing protein, partial [bacterium]|nr:integrase core domain-containing protein [bacterium]
LRLVREGTLALRPDQIPAASTITRILQRHDQWEPKVPGPGADTATQRFERPQANALWQMDFKGEFPLRNQQPCYPLTLLDDHSRFDLGLRACANMHRTTVQQALTAIFRRYGLPEALLIDNGAPWGSGIRDAANRPYYTTLGVWWMRLGIRVIHSRPRHPQTHGKNERFHGTLHAELLRYEQFRDLAQAQDRFDWWRHRYNHERPHQALDDQVPSDRYTPSPRELPTTLPSIEYGPDDAVRRVDSSGKISLQGTKYKIGRAFCRLPVAVRPQVDTAASMVYFCHQPIREIGG